MSLKSINKPSKFLNVYDLGMKMYTSHPIKLSFSFMKSCDWLRGVHIHAEIVHVPGL